MKPEEQSTGDRLKNMKLIYKLRNDTYNDVLKWDVIYRDSKAATFSTSFKITENKELCFTLRCSLIPSEKIEENVLRVIFRTKDLKPPISSSTSTLKAISLKHYPSLVQLIKLLKNLYLNEENKPVENNVLVANNFEEYKQHVINSTKEMINRLPNTNDKIERYAELYDIIDDMYDAKTMEEINELMFKAHELEKRKNPIGTPRWSI